MPTSETRSELVENLKGNRAELLLTINDNHPGETPKFELNDVCKSVNYHLEKLLEEGVIEVVAREDVGSPIPMRVFKITEKGRDIVPDLLEQTDSRPIPSAVEERMAELKDEVGEAQQEAREAQERVDKLRDWIKENVETAQG